MVSRSYANIVIVYDSARVTTHIVWSKKVGVLPLVSFAITLEKLKFPSANLSVS